MEQKSLSALSCMTISRQRWPDSAQSCPHFLFTNLLEQIATVIKISPVPVRVAKIVASRTTKVFLLLVFKAKARRAPDHKGWMLHVVIDVPSGIRGMGNAQGALGRTWARVVLVCARVSVAAIAVMVPITAPHRHITTRVAFVDGKSMAMCHAAPIIGLGLSIPITLIAAPWLFCCLLLHQCCTIGTATAVWIIAIATHEHRHLHLCVHTDFLPSGFSVQLLHKVIQQAILLKPVHSYVNHALFEVNMLNQQ
mmetsp:Transcript_134429/g.218764  ORF Transcript_134429/g.218764 Transcript_134429/m.218764 type:complete len:252 (+) Transcript_134429:543-1298(+)